jgi:hypothetical protein
MPGFLAYTREDLQMQNISIATEDELRRIREEVYQQALKDIEEERGAHDRRAFEAMWALLEAEMDNNNNNEVTQADKIGNKRRSRPTPLAELAPDAPELNWARSLVKDHERRQHMAATLAVRNAIAAMKTHSVATAIRMRRHFTPKRGHVSRGASLRAAAKSGDSNDDGDPDPDDRIILDPYSAINNHHLSTTQNRISRKAILAHKNSIDKTHPRVYEWYVSRTLREIECAIVDTISDSGRFDISLEARDEAHEGAWIFFQRLCESHDFGKTPNLVFFGKKGLVSKSFVRTPEKLHEAVTADIRNPGQAEHRGISAEIGILKTRCRADAADISAVANGLISLGDNVERKWWRSDEDAEERAKEYQGVKIKHLPPQPIRERAYHFATMVSLSSSGEDGDGLDRLELEAVDAHAETVDSEDWQDDDVAAEEVVEIDPEVMGTNFMPDTEVFDTADADVPPAPVRDDDAPDDLIDDTDTATDEEILRAGTIARQLVLHVQRAHNQSAAAQEVVEVLNLQPVSMQNSVVEALRKDFANVEAVNAILRAAGLAELEQLKPEPFSIDAELTDFANRDENALAACPDMYFADFMDKVGNEITSGNVLKLLRLRVENRSGRFSPEIQKVAAILLRGYEMQKGVRV